MYILFYLSCLLLIGFEVYRVYFLKPQPVPTRSINKMYFISSRAWIFRSVAGLLILITLPAALSLSLWNLLLLIFAIIFVYVLKDKVNPKKHFLKIKRLTFKNAGENIVGSHKIIIGIIHNGQAKAYPIQYIAYHHVIEDEIAGEPVSITYCPLSRTAKIYALPMTGKALEFQLSGVHNCNALLKDSVTHSWWQQVTGEAVAGRAKGKVLAELQHVQVSLSEWINAYPDSLIMQPDPEFSDGYKRFQDYEIGQGAPRLKTDFASWQHNSWIVGIQIDTSAKAYDWNKLKELRIINDQIENIPLVLILAADDKSFFAYRRSDEHNFTLEDDKIISGQSVYNLFGQPLDAADSPLERIVAYQQFWHSWKHFHPNTETF